jgi:hypothetical protein
MCYGQDLHPIARGLAFQPPHQRPRGSDLPPRACVGSLSIGARGWSGAARGADATIVEEKPAAQPAYAASGNLTARAGREEFGGFLLLLGRRAPGRLCRAPPDICSTRLMSLPIGVPIRLQYPIVFFCLFGFFAASLAILFDAYLTANIPLLTLREGPPPVIFKTGIRRAGV